MYVQYEGWIEIDWQVDSYLATLPSVVSVCLRVREARGTYCEALYKLPIDFGQVPKVDVDVAVA